MGTQLLSRTASQPLPAKGSLSKNLRSNMLLYNQAKQSTLTPTKELSRILSRTFHVLPALKPENSLFQKKRRCQYTFISVWKCSGQILCPEQGPTMGACLRMFAKADCLSRMSWITSLLRIVTYVLSHASVISKYCQLRAA